MIWFALFLWHINHCRLFDAKSSLYIFYIYTICEHILLITFLNEPELIFWRTVKWFQVLLAKWIILFTINELFAHN